MRDETTAVILLLYHHTVYFCDCCCRCRVLSTSISSPQSVCSMSPYGIAEGVLHATRRAIDMLACLHARVLPFYRAKTT